MGFLSGLFGGSETTTPASGFYSSPAEYQNLYKNVVGGINNNIGQINTDMFRPLDIMPQEQQALDSFSKGFAPTQESLTSDIGMLMNPFNKYVMDEVNRAAGSDYSILKRDMTSAGQFGSNRQRLGANDIEQTRLGTIGKLQQGAYDTALNSVLNKIIPQRQSDAAGMLGVGEFQRNLDMQQKTSPLQAYQAQLGLVNGIPTQFGNFGSPQSTVKTSGGLGGLLGGLGQIGGLASGLGGLSSAAAGTGLAGSLGMSGMLGSLGSGLGSLGSLLSFSDRRLKTDIKKIGTENGYNIYSFKYKGESDKLIGVMADEVEQINPGAVHIVNGYKAVDYNAIGVRFRHAV